jgi:TolA-binding protein
MKKIILLAIMVSSMVFFSGCLASKQDAINIKLELRELRKEIERFRKVNADLATNIESQNVYLQQIAGKVDESNYKFSDMILRKESLTEISNRLSSIEDKLFKLWVSTVPIASALPEDIYDMAKKDYIRGNYDLAISGFNKLINDYPDCSLIPKARYELALTYYASGAWQNASNELDTFLGLYNNNELTPSVMLAKARCLKRLGQHVEAKKLFDVIIKTYPFSDEAKSSKDELGNYDNN